ncbi:hypothetical protein AB0J38_17335 [Streptomyces sp. NPDC050095]|uniref:deoxynucleotide monophosphate kinase family protein n=1 Tax=unclassified Streptomyces TaxID=2593676 RepID=UPI003440224A
MPTYPHIALMGPARSGKDTVASLLVHGYQYTRLAFADRIKEAALTLDPSVPLPNYPRHFVRLSGMVRIWGWERAKTRQPEVRRLLQQLGQAMRAVDEEIWRRPVMDRVAAATDWNLPVVVSDVRHPDEADALQAAGAVLVRIDRPGADAGPHAGHRSETALARRVPDFVLLNTGTFTDLAREVESLINEVRK